MPRNLDLSGFRNAKDRAAFVAWLGRVQHRKRLLRQDNSPKMLREMSREMSGKMLLRMCSIICPWRAEEYPGFTSVLADIIGLPIRSTKNYLNRGLVTGQVARRAASWLKAHAAECVALAEEFERVPYHDPRKHIARVRRGRPAGWKPGDGPYKDFKP